MGEYVFNDLSDKDLDELMRNVQQERNRRAEVRKGKLINNFEKAFDALREAGYDICVNNCGALLFDDFEIY